MNKAHSPETTNEILSEEQNSRHFSNPSSLHQEPNIINPHRRCLPQEKRWCDVDSDNEDAFFEDSPSPTEVSSGFPTFPKEVNSHEFEHLPVYTLDDMSPTFYVHRTHVFQCSPAAFSGYLFAVCEPTGVYAEKPRIQMAKQRRARPRSTWTPHSWDPTDEEVDLMCNAFRSIAAATWFCLDTKRDEKPHWSNKCLQHCFLKLCEGRVQRHGQRLFNRRCVNDSTR